MTAFSGVYSSLTGLLGFSTALGVVSDNISNLNTAGFKENESLFRDLGPAVSDRSTGPASFELAIGQGTSIAGQTRNFAEGQIQSTGNPTNLAINGTGFFILNANGVDSYTRDGQFSFDGAGHLISSVGGAHVQAVNASGARSDLIVEQAQSFPPTATTQVKFNQSLSTGQTNAFTVSNIKVIDVGGASRALSASFTQAPATTIGQIDWQVTVTDDQGNTIGTGSISYDGSGSPTAGLNTLSVTLATAKGSSSQITFDFGDSTSLSLGTTSSLQVESSDGVPPGVLTSITFDGSGVVQLAFSNGKTKTGAQVALAGFTNPESLSESGSGMFTIPRGSSVQPVIGHAGAGGFGSIQDGSIELSNVDLGQEFAAIIVLQRGYQGSSQVLNISSQLLETLYNSLANR